MPSAVSAYRMMSANTGAATWPPSASLVGPLEVDGDDVLRVVGRGEADERGHVAAALVAAALGVGPLRGAGLAGDAEALDLRRAARCRPAPTTASSM